MEEMSSVKKQTIETIRKPILNSLYLQKIMGNMLSISHINRAMVHHSVLPWIRY